MIPVDANLVVIDFSVSGGNRNIEEMLRILDDYPKKPAVMILNMQIWAFTPTGAVSEKENRTADMELTVGEDDVAEAQRRLALSRSNAAAGNAPLMRSFVHSFIRSFVHLFMYGRSFVRSFVYL